MAINNAINQYPIVDALLGSWTPGAGTITSTDSILTAMQKISGSSVSLSGNNVWTGTNSFGNTVTFSTLTASTVPYLDASKNLTSSAVTPTELGYVSGVTSAIQTQLGTKVNLDQTVGQTIGTTGARLTKLWATDITVTNAIVGSITGNAATVTTNANLTGPITSVGNATSVASQTGTGSTFVMSDGPSFTGSIAHSITAQASVAETFYTLSISDDATGRFYIENNSATDNFFVPGLRGVTTGNSRGLTIVGQGTTDTGSNPLMELRSRIGTSSTSTTRPLLHLTNHTTIVGILSANGSFTLGSTAGTGAGSLFVGAGTFNGTTTINSAVAGVVVNHTGTTTNALDIIASSLTTGNVASFYSNSADGGSGRALVLVINDNPAAAFTIPIQIRQDAPWYGLYMEHNGNYYAQTIISTATTFNVFRIVASNLTSGSIMELYSNSADATARQGVSIHNDNSAAVGFSPLNVIQDAVISTNFKLIANFAGVKLYVSNGTTPNGNLSGTAGDQCWNGASGQSYRCTGTTNWTAQ